MSLMRVERLQKAFGSLVVTRVRDSGLSILLVKQNVRAALEVADRHDVMSKEAICHTCTTEDIRKNADLPNPYLGPWAAHFCFQCGRGGTGGEH